MRISNLPALLLLAPIAGLAQNYIISTFAGGAAPPSGVPGASAKIGAPDDLVTDSKGDFYFVSLNSAFRLDSNGTLTRIAGTGAAAYSGDGGSGASAKLSDPLGIALDGAGNVYIADTGNNRIRRVTPNGTIATVAGTGVSGYSGDGGPALNAELIHPSGIVFDSAGNLYILEAARIRKVSPSGLITTIAGTGVAGESGDNGPAINAQIKARKGLAIDGSGNLFFTDMTDQRVRKISAADGTITTVAGTIGVTLGSMQGTLDLPTDVAVDAVGNVYISTANGIQTVPPGGTQTSVSVPGAAAFAVSTVAVDGSGNLYFADGNFTIRELTYAGTITTLAGPGGPVILPANASPTSVTFSQPTGVAADANGNILIADTQNSFLWRVSSDATINIIGDFTGLNGVAIDGAGNYYALGSQSVTKAHFTGATPPEPVVVAGGGTSSADGIAATSARVLFARGIAVDAAGNIFIADTSNHKVRKVSMAGVITTIAGTGTLGFSGDGGPAADAQLAAPQGIAVDAAGNLYIADTGNYRIREITIDGNIATIAGGGGALEFPRAVAVDSGGNLYVADEDQIRKITNGTITTIAGTGIIGYTGDGGIATAAALNEPTGVAVDGGGNVYVADQMNNVVRVLRPTNAPVMISAVVDAASESATAVTPGKIVAIYGAGLGPANAAINSPVNDVFGPSVGGTSVTINGLAAPVIFASTGQINAIVPYGVAGSATAVVVVSSAYGTSSAFSVPVAATAPSFFSQNASGAGQIAAVNLDGSLNDAAHPVAIGGYVSLYATGEGQTSPAGVDGALAMSTVLPKPVLPVSVTVGGVAVTPTYAGAAPTEVAGLMQIVVQIPADVTPGGYVQVDVHVGSGATVSGAAWIAVSGE